MSVDKVSISVSNEDLRWARDRARAKKSSLSAVFAEALRLSRQLEARRALLQKLPDSSEDGLLAVEEEWKPVED